MVRPHYFIGITNKKIGIYDSLTGKLLPVISIKNLDYLKPKKYFSKTTKKKFLTMNERFFWKERILRYRFLKKFRNNMEPKPEKFYQKRRRLKNTEPYNQHDICNFIRQVFTQIFIENKIPKNEISSIVFVLNEIDNYKIRSWILYHSKKHGINKIHLINWRTAGLMEILTKSKIEVVNNEKISILYIFDEFYHVYCLQRYQNRWHVKDYQIFLNNFTSNGFHDLQKNVSAFNPKSFIVYFYGENVRKLQAADYFFVKGLAPKNVKILRKNNDSEMDLINGAVLKSRSFGRDAKINKYDVLETCYFYLRANLDHRAYIRLNSYLREYPFDIKISACSRGLYYLWLEYNFHGKDSNWKLHKIYPHSFVRNKIDFKVEFDTNGVSKIIVFDPPQAALEDHRSFVFARFKVRRRRRILPPLPPPPRFKTSGKRMNRVSKTPKNYRQRRIYQHRKKLSTPPRLPPPLMKEEKEKRIDPGKPKRKIEDPKLKQSLRRTAERMNKWQTRKFLME